MKTIRKEPSRRTIRAARVLMAATCFAVAIPVTGFADNIVVEWNATAISTALAVGQGPVPQTRSMAIVAVAVNDAVNAISMHHPTFGVVPCRSPSRVRPIPASRAPGRHSALESMR